ncbi:MAG: site-specific integrase [Sedimentisphaerales bacterium]|nr:site-specific integrase [Sedimentisphaerales bacterium]
MSEGIKKQRKFKGSVYARNGRYYYQYKTPEGDYKTVPLIPRGGRFATKDRNLAYALAGDVWAKMTATPQAEYDGTMVSMAAKYIAYAKGYYKGSLKYDLVKQMIGALVDFCQPGMLAEDFGPKKLKEYREHLIGTGKLCRKTLNQRIGMIKQCFKWAASEEFVPGSVFMALQSVSGLRKGRSRAKDRPPVGPVPEIYVERVLPHLSSVVRSMVELQMLTGMRSGELTIMRPVDIDTSGKIWFYRPASHKTEHLGHKRLVALGPKAQAIASRFMAGRKLDDYLFKPIEATWERYGSENRQENRPGVSYLAHYTPNSYRTALQRGIRRARKAGECDMPDFTPHQLRHTAATKVRKLYGLDASRAVLGHSTTDVTEIYAELDQRQIEKIAMNIG